MYVIKDSWLTYAIGKGRYYAGKGKRGAFPGRGGSGRSFGYAFKDIVFYEPILDMVLNDPSGKVGRWLTLQAEKVAIGAKAQVGVRTGALKASIKVHSHERNPRGQSIMIGSTLNYAYVHHEGSKPVIITPKGGHKVLRFRVGARIIYGKRVIHPGTKPNRYLKNSLKLVDGVK
jgi:hypothetical protein